MDEANERPPLPTPTKRENIKERQKLSISAPYGFRHISHIDSKTRKNVIISSYQIQDTDNLPQAPTYEKVRQHPTEETPILGRRTPPNIRTSGVHPSLLPSDSENRQFNDSETSVLKVNVGWHKNNTSVINYENMPTKHLYLNTARNERGNEVQLSKKKNPPPPPPSKTKPRLKSEEELGSQANSEDNIIYRNLPMLAQISGDPISVTINTPERIEQSNVGSLILERPTLLGEMKVGLDDPIPLQGELSSKYSTYNILTVPQKSEPEVVLFNNFNQSNYPEQSTTEIGSNIKEISNKQKQAPPRPPAPARKTLMSSESKCNLTKKLNENKLKSDQSNAAETINGLYMDLEKEEEGIECRKNHEFETVHNSCLPFSPNYDSPAESDHVGKLFDKYGEATEMTNMGETKTSNVDKKTFSKDIVEPIMEQDQDRPPIPKPRTKKNIPQVEIGRNEIICTGTPVIVMDKNMLGKLTNDCNQLRVVSEASCTMSDRENVESMNEKASEPHSDEDEVVSRF